MKKSTKPIRRDKPPRIRVALLLNAAATLFAAVLVTAMHSPKLPPANGD